MPTYRFSWSEIVYKMLDVEAPTEIQAKDIWESELYEIEEETIVRYEHGEDCEVLEVD